MNAHALAEPSVRTFLSAFQERAQARPGAPAVVQDGTTLTYGQLDRRSNALANYLQSLAVGRETLVGLLLDRSPEMVVALLAIWKAGAAYVPLDPAFPVERLSSMVRDARPAVVITHSRLLDKLPTDAPTLCLDRDAPRIEAHEQVALPLAVVPSTRAYVIYTSGSTGAPKGVEVTHGAVVNLLESFAERPGLDENAQVLAHTTLSFDIAVLELWLPLWAGARILLAPAGRTDARLLADILAANRISFVQATPSLWRLLLAAGWRAGRGVTALSGGEALSRELADEILATGADLWNVYGPTETTVWSSIWHVERHGPILIGDPIRATELLILDDEFQLVGPGVIGELCIGGAGLARGYLNRPDLTAEKFPPHPFSDAPGARIYRTGDLARSHGDGGIECLGRIDHQMKIDGFRIEPAEVEGVLTTHPAVQQAVVCAVTKAPGDRRLAAYIVHGQHPAPDTDELRRLARTQLPGYMVPSEFVMLRDAPLTPTGKIDRHALPAIGPQTTPRTRPGRAPWSPLERRLAQMWREVLGIDQVSAEDNFFDVGGRSRLGAELFARIETELGLRLPLATLFEAPTLSALARAIENRNPPAAHWRSLVPIRAGGTTPPLFCIHPVGGNVLAYRDLARRLGPDVPCYGLQGVGLDGMTPPLRTVEAMAERYIEEIRTAQSRGPYHLCGFSFGGLVAFEMARRLTASGERVGLLALLDTEFPEYPTSRLLEWLTRSELGNRYLYRSLLRARRHYRSLRRLGPAAYLRSVGRADAEQPATPGYQALDGPTLLADRVRRANTRAAIDYVPRRYPGHLTYFRANHPRPRPDRRDLWARLAASIEIIDVEGGHSDMRMDPQAQIVAAELRRRIATDLTGHGSHGLHGAREVIPTSKR